MIRKQHLAQKERFRGPERIYLVLYHSQIQYQDILEHCKLNSVRCGGLHYSKLGNLGTLDLELATSPPLQNRTRIVGDTATRGRCLRPNTFTHKQSTVIKRQERAESLIH